MVSNWIEIKWSKNQLHKKSVDFAVRIDGGRLMGRGIFNVIGEEEKKIQVEIEVCLPAEKTTSLKLQVSQRIADAIQPANPETGADFVCYL